MRLLPKSKRRRVLLLAALAVSACLAAAAYLKLNALQRDAFRLAEAGRTAAAALHDLADALKTGDPHQLAAHYSRGYQDPSGGVWTETPTQNLDGIDYYTWMALDPGPVDHNAITTRLEAFIHRLGEVTYAKFKLGAVEHRDGDRLGLRATLWLRGTRDGRPMEALLPFRMELALHDDGARVMRQNLLPGGTTVVGPDRGFEDITDASGLGTMRIRFNPRFQTPEWAPHTFPIARYSAAGVSAADYDGDGFQDLFFANGDAARLYRNLGDGRFEDATAAAGLPLDLIGVNTAVFADLDNDGHQDLFLGCFTEPNRLFRNLGDGRFAEAAQEDLGPPLVAAASAADFDGDGDLDLYLGRYLDPRTALPTTPFYTRNGQPNSLLQNDGGFHFTDVAEKAGVADVGLTLAAVWADYDTDGDQDLYLANDFGRNLLYRNRGDGTFEDVSEATGSVDIGFGMSASWGDVDNDGDLDLYVANVHSGQRWYGQAPTLKNYLVGSLREGTFWRDWPAYRDLYHHLGADWMRAGDRIIKGNTLLRNDGHGRFSDDAAAAGANPFGWYWGSAFFDYDNDGRQDLYTANGWVSNHNTADF